MNESFPEDKKGDSTFLNLKGWKKSSSQHKPIDHCISTRLHLHFYFRCSCSVCAPLLQLQIRVLRTSLTLVSPPLHKLNLCSHCVQPVELIPMICYLLAKSPTECTSRKERQPSTCQNTATG